MGLSEDLKVLRDRTTELNEKADAATVRLREIDDALIEAKLGIDHIGVELPISGNPKSKYHLAFLRCDHDRRHRLCIAERELAGCKPMTISANPVLEASRPARIAAAAVLDDFVHCLRVEVDRQHERLRESMAEIRTAIEDSKPRSEP